MWPVHSKILLSLLGIQYPIIQAPMAGVASASFVASVSSVGGLGSFASGL